MAEAKKKPNVFSRIGSFFRSCVGEIKKITWPTVAQTSKNFGVVVLVIIVAGIAIYGLDRGLYALLHLVMNTGAM